MNLKKSKLQKRMFGFLHRFVCILSCHDKTEKRKSGDGDGWREIGKGCNRTEKSTNNLILEPPSN